MQIGFSISITNTQAPVVVYLLDDQGQIILDDAGQPIILDGSGL